MPRLGSRDLFPDLAPFAYLNHAAISPPSDPVRQAVSTWLQRYAAVGVGAYAGAAEQRASLKCKLAGLIGCEPSDLALTSATSHGIIDLAAALRFRPADTVLCYTGEFPANVTPWQQAAQAAGASVRFLPQEGLSDDAVLTGLEAELSRAPIRLIAVSAVQFSTGRAMPLAAITQLAHAHGALVCVDGIQGIGVMPIDLSALGVDFVASGAHKWLMGLEGVGFVYIRPDRLPELDPTPTSWLSHEDPLGFLLEGPGKLRYDRPIRKSADFLEGHSGNAIGCAALEAAIDLLLAIGVPRIQAHVRAYNDAMEAGLVDRSFTSLRPADSPTGTLSLLPPEGIEVVPLAHQLAELGVSLSTPDGKLRISPHWPNALDEVPRVLQIVDGVL